MKSPTIYGEDEDEERENSDGPYKGARYLVAPPLFCAVASRDHQGVLTLLRARADLHKRSSDGQSTLGAACRLGEAIIARSLIQGGANVNEPNGDNIPPIFEAVCAAAEAAAAAASATSEREMGVNLAAPRSLSVATGVPTHQSANNSAPSEVLELVALLVDARADVSTTKVSVSEHPTPFDGLTPIQVARRLHDEALAAVLLRATPLALDHEQHDMSDKSALQMVDATNITLLWDVST